MALEHHVSTAPAVPPRRGVAPTVVPDRDLHRVAATRCGVADAPLFSAHYRPPAEPYLARARVAAYLPRNLLNRLCASLGASAVCECGSISELIDAVTTGDSAVLAVDPVLCTPAAHFPRALSDALGPRIAIVLYTQPTTTSARLCFAWACQGVGHLVLAGLDDDERDLRAIFSSVLNVMHRTETLVSRLEVRLALLPAALASAVRRLFADYEGIGDVDTLVASACMCRRSVDRWLHRAALAPVNQLLAAARLLRAYAAIQRGEMSLHRAASVAGFPSVRSLALHARTMLGEGPAALRRLAIDELHDRVEEHLRRR